jgi:hypothetical protein
MVEGLFVALCLLAGVLIVRRQFLYVSVGVEGLELHYSRGPTLLLRYSEIDGIHNDGPEISLRISESCSVDMFVLGSNESNEASALVTCVRERIKLYRHRTTNPQIGAPVTLARGGRTMSAWLHDLTVLGEVTAPFRGVAIPHEVLWGVVESPNSAPTVRVGAAILLRKTLKTAAQQRLRVAADACASGRTRVALEAVASAGDEGEIDVSLDTLNDDEFDRPFHTRVPRRVL